MRISDQLVTSLVSRHFTNANQAFFEANQRILTGQKIQGPGEDPALALQIDHTQDALDQLSSFANMRPTVELQLGTLEDTIVSIGELVGRADALAVAVSSSGGSSVDNAARATELRQIKDQIVQLLNQAGADGEFLTGGTADATAPWAGDGTYQGAPSNREVQVGPGLFVETTMTAEDIFGGAAPTVFETLDDMIAVLEDPAAAPGDVEAAAQAALDGFDGVQRSIAVAIADVGGRLSLVQDAQTIEDEVRFRLQTRLAVLADVDIIEESTRLSAAEAALAATVEVSRNLLNNGIGSFLRSSF